VPDRSVSSAVLDTFLSHKGTPGELTNHESDDNNLVREEKA
jgi:hypothetical protein